MKVPLKKQFNLFLLLGTFLFSSAALFGQTGTVTGTVLDANGEPIIGANILIEGTSQGTVSDINGKYTLPNVPAGEVTITVSFVGYLSEKETINMTEGGAAEINFSIEEDLQQLSEVVVIGYGSIKKSDLTGSVTSVDTEELQKLPNSGVANMLQGMAAGVQVLQNSGQPGADPVIRVRGLATVNGGSPLIVIDGISGGSLSDLNPSDIQSIEVLKDAASQSIYGNAGGNGVILVTTKKGKKGFHVNLDLYAGLQKAWNTDVGIASAQEYAELYNRVEELRGNGTYFPLEGGQYLNPETNEPLQTTNWTDEIFRTGLVQNYNLSVSAGNDIGKVFLGMNYNNEEGTVKKTYNERLAIRLNSEITIAKRITIGENFSITNIDRSTQGERSEYSSPLSTSIQMLPFVPVYAEDGSGNFDYAEAGIASNIANPLSQIEYNNNLYESTAINGNVFARIEIIKGLTFESRYGMGYTPTSYHQFSPSFDIGPADNISASASSALNTLQYNTTELRKWQFQNFLTYQTSIANIHNFTLTAGYESGFSEYSFKNMSDSYADDSIPFNQDSYLEFEDPNNIMDVLADKRTTESGFGYFFRLNYDIAGIFLLQGNIRTDKSSKFGPNMRQGTFKSVSTGLKFSEFDFIKDLNFLSFGKIRVGYGETGNNDIQPFLYLGTIGSVPMHSYAFGDDPQRGAALLTASNLDLHWETVITQNIGLDLRFLENRLGLTFDYFQRSNEDMLLYKTVPMTVGYYVTAPGNELGDPNIDTRPLVNYGTLSNEGFEISVNYKDRIGELSYSIFGNLTRATTTITDIGDPLTAGDGRNTSDVCQSIEGGPVSAFYGYRTDGVYTEADMRWYSSNNRWRRVVVNPNGDFEVVDEVSGTTYTTLDPSVQEPGAFKLVDASGNGRIDVDDIVQIGDPNPDFTYGFGLNLEYKNFDLNAFFQGSYGNDIFNLLRTNTYNIDNGQLNITSDLLNGYIPAVFEGGDANNPPTQVSPEGNVNTGIKRPDGRLSASDFFVEDGSYLRLKNLQIGYTLPAASLEKLKIQKLRIYFGGTNLLTFTKYSGFDPEVNETNILERGFDRGTYPQAKMYSIGINCTF